jgi:hypothetical protein
MKKQNTKTTKFGAFDRLFKEAFDDTNLFDDGGEEVMDELEGGAEVEVDNNDEGGADVTITLTGDQVSVLKDILALVDGDDSEEDVLGGEDDVVGIEGVTDIEELEEEAVEMEKAPSAESAASRTKDGKAAPASGDLEKDSSVEDGEEKQYKFVKRQKPQELKHKTTKGSSGEKAV